MNTKEIIDALRAEVTEDGHVLLDRLEAELDLSFWPDEVFAAAEDVFGRCVYARTGRTYQALDRRIRHALRVWDEKYGPLNPAQEHYAERVLAVAIRNGAKAALGGKNKYACVQATIGRMVNHETVHDGFTRRAEKVEFDLEKEMAA